MNVIVGPGLSLDEFLSWEREQPLRYEFDGTQPIPMTGGTVAHARLVRRIMEAMYRLLPTQYEAFGGDLKVLTAPNRIRYPDLLVVSSGPDPNTDTVAPVVVFEVLSPSTKLTDLRVKPDEYASVPSILAYVVLPQEDAADTIALRRSNDWAAERVADTLDLPEIGVWLPLSDLYG
jgi:Uma2 family endonuclease